MVKKEIGEKACLPPPRKWGPQALQQKIVNCRVVPALSGRVC
jgi:hypothetical protein